MIARVGAMRLRMAERCGSAVTTTAPRMRPVVMTVVDEMKSNGLPSRYPIRPPMSQREGMTDGCNAAVPLTNADARASFLIALTRASYSYHALRLARGIE